MKTTTLADRVNAAMAGPPQVKGVDLAHACGVKPPSVADWKSGRTKEIRGVPLIKAAAFLGVNVKWLAEGLGPMRTEPGAAHHAEPEASVAIPETDFEAALRTVARMVADVSPRKRDLVALSLSELAKHPELVDEITEDLRRLLGVVSTRKSEMLQTVIPEEQIAIPTNVRPHGKDLRLSGQRKAR